MKISVDARRFTSKKELHSAMREALGQENYWGDNLDALYDCLTCRFEPTELTIKHWSSAMLRLPDYANALWHMLDDASDMNQMLKITIE